MQSFQWKIVLPKSSSVTKIVFAGDFHVGSKNCNKKAIKELVRKIKDNEDTYVVLMGDMIEAITHKDSKRFDPHSIDPEFRIADMGNLPYIQMDVFYGLIEPIKHKILGVIQGNHEESYSKHNCGDIYSYLINKLTDDEEQRKSMKLGMVAIGMISFITPGDRTAPRYNTTLYLNHGDGGGGFKPGYPTNKVFDVFEYEDCDISVMGHIHQLVMELPKYYGYNVRKKEIEFRRRFKGSSGTFLNTYVDGSSSYFEHKGRKESDIGCLECSIWFDGYGKMHIRGQKLIFDY